MILLYYICTTLYTVRWFPKDQLLFQLIEGTNLTVWRRYYSLKMMLADTFPEDRLMYRDIKGLFIEAVLSAYRQAAGEDEEEED